MSSYFQKLLNELPKETPRKVADAKVSREDYLRKESETVAKKIAALIKIRNAAKDPEVRKEAGLAILSIVREASSLK